MGTIVGNTLSASHDVIYQVILGAVSVDSPITSDNIINSVEQNNLFISGTSDISNTVTVAVSDGTSTVSSVVTVTSNTWSAILDVSSLVDGPVIVSVTGVDALSSVYTDATSATLQTTLPSLSVDEPLFDDNVINEDESTGDIISGTGTPGDVITVTLTDGGNTITETVIVGGDGTWEVTVNTETLNDGPITITTSTTDEVGNVSTTVTIVEQDTSGPTSTINTPVSGDDIVNAVEDNSLTLNGESEPDSMVTVTLTDENGDTVTVMTTTDQNGDWNINNIDISGLDDGPITITVIATDESGNDGEPSTHTIEHTTNGPVVSINTPIEGDNIINAMEEETTYISGVGTPGTIIDVFVTDGSTTITTTVIVPDSGIWTTTLDVSSLDDGPITITATGTISATDGTNTVGSDELFISPSGQWQTTLDLSTLEDGLVTIVATATSTSGNVGEDTDYVVVVEDLTAVCENLPLPICNNDICEPSETVEECPEDCFNNECGDGICSLRENDSVCPQDCGSCDNLPSCGNDVCDLNENAGSCPDDCSADPPCGNGVCDPEENAGSCDDCAVNPTRCGDDLCDPEENGGNCPEDCSNDNPSSCGNSICETNENSGNCPEDCSISVCNRNLICDPFEASGTCEDCSVSSCNNNGICELNEVPQQCSSDCSNLPHVIIAVYLDANYDGIRNANENTLPNIRFYLDLNFNEEYDSATEPLYVTSGNPAQADIILRPGTYVARILTASLEGNLVVGRTLEIGADNFIFNTADGVIKMATYLDLLIPVSENVPPIAKPISVSAYPGIVVIPNVINQNTDLNNNIDLNHGFFPLNFPSDLATYNFAAGELAVIPFHDNDEPISFQYQLCDEVGACSSVETISIKFIDLTQSSPVPTVVPVPTTVIVVQTTPVPTPVIVYVFDDGDFNYGFADSTSSDASTKMISSFIIIAISLIAILL